ncbi:MAG: pantoate--beta-alanine ligase, partial [Burkholderiaceae bacterium]|nr:pantoate--beta-alanine ligase [Burkholderiaceae bacterium]
GIEAIEREAMDTMRANGWEPDYMTVRNSSTLLAPQHGERDLVVLGAAKLGSTRLIDNLRVRL